MLAWPESPGVNTAATTSSQRDHADRIAGPAAAPAEEQRQYRERDRKARSRASE